MYGAREEPIANARNDSQQGCKLLLRQMLHVVASGAQTDATTLQFGVQAGPTSSQFLREY